MKCINARESIARALVEATGGWPDLSGGSASDGDIMLPVLDAAAKEIFNIPDGDDVQVLAATGYIETAPIGSRWNETGITSYHWITRLPMTILRQELETVCDTAW